MLKITLPIEIYVDDYHEFSLLKKYLSQLTGSPVKVEEIDIIDGRYAGIVYLKKDQEYKELKRDLLALSDLSG